MNGHSHTHTHSHPHGQVHTQRRERAKDESTGSHHDHHDHMMASDLKKRFFVSLIVTVPVLLLSEMIRHFLGLHFTFPGDKYVLFVLSSVIFFYGGWPFLTGLASEIKERNPGMMTLVGLAITVAYLYSTSVVFGLKGMDFFWELATLIDLMLLGHWIEMKSVAGASRSLELLVKMLPSVAHVIRNSEVNDVPVTELRSGDLLLIKPGEKIPADGIISEGESYIDESLLTGESRPVKRMRNDQVTAGSVNGNGSLKIRIVRTGKESYLSKVIAMVEEAQHSRSRMQNLSHRAARRLTIIAIGAGLITLTAWLASGKEFSFALERMVTVMVISCPHALGLAVPLVVAISTTLAARRGLLIRNRSAFEESGHITAIVFDKTGTLTKGNFGVTRFKTISAEFSDGDIIKLAAAPEKNSEHPIAQAIVVKARQLKLDVPDATNFSAITGKGIEATVENKNVKIVSPGYLKEINISIPKEAFTSRAETVVFVLIDEKPAGYIALADEVRHESLQAVKTFKENGIKVLMATGDNKNVADAVSKSLKLDGYYAEVLPHQKVEIIKSLQDKGEFVAMAGDGINDAPALAQANVGIAVGSGTDIAADTADIILVNSNPADILQLILFGKATYTKMIQNLAWATAYNVIAIPLAAGVLYSQGIMLSPAAGAILMSISTIIVALNAQLLRKKLS